MPYEEAPPQPRPRHRPGALGSRLERAGCSFEVLPGPEVPLLLPELKAISDTWLAETHTREKGFSVGLFDEGYPQRFPVGIVGQLVATRVPTSPNR